MSYATFVMNRVSRRILTAILACSLTVPILTTGRTPASYAGGHDETKPQPPLVLTGLICRQTNLVSDFPGVALVEDLFLVNPVGVALSPTGPFWVVNNSKDFATIYKGDVAGSPFVRNTGLSTVALPPPPTILPIRNAPTGIVANNTNDFVFGGSHLPPAPARFIFSSLIGALDAWQDNSGSTASFINLNTANYTGLTMGSNAAGNFLFAADFLNGKIDVFDRNFNPSSVSGNFADPTVPTNYHPFNIQNLNGSFYVTYGEFNPFTSLPNSGQGKGFVRKFDTNGVRDAAFAINGGPVPLVPVNAPWGMVIAPPSFAGFTNALLVGNFGSVGLELPSINAFNAATGAHLGSLIDEGGSFIKISKLWSLVTGNGVNGGDPNTIYFSAGFLSEQHGLFGSLTPVMSPPPSVIQFSSDDYVAAENAGHIDITVNRTGDVSGIASVNYATVDDSGAGQKSAYQIALGKLIFNPGETSKTFRVLIVDNNGIFGGATFEVAHLVLSNAKGAGLTTPNFATRLRVHDDEGDTPRQPPNIIDDTRFFVRQHYHDFLNRVPGGGLDFWVNEITSCGNDAQCIEVKRINVSAAFFLSIEFQRTGMLTYLTHKAAGFSFLPRYGPFMRDVQALQKGYAFGAPGAEAVLEANKQAFFNEFITGPEFVAKYASLTNQQYVDTLITNTNVPFSTSERDALVDGLNNGTETRATVLRKIAEKEAFRQKEFNTAFVLMEYFGYLRRNPDGPPDNNLAGFNFWLNKLNQFNGNFVEAEMVKAFISSIEYRGRFGP